MICKPGRGLRGWVWRLVSLKQAMLVTKWGSLQDTFVMDAATHPRRSSPFGTNQPHLCGPLAKPA